MDHIALGDGLPAYSERSRKTIDDLTEIIRFDRPQLSGEPRPVEDEPVDFDGR